MMEFSVKKFLLVFNSMLSCLSCKSKNSFMVSVAVKKSFRSFDAVSMVRLTLENIQGNG